MNSFTSTHDCFVVLPATGSIYATKISFQNLLRQIKEKDPAAAAQVSYLQIENKLTVKISTNKKFELNYSEDTDIQQDKHFFSINLENMVVRQLIERLAKLLNWLLKIDKYRFKATIKVANNRLRIGIHESQANVQAAAPSVKPEKLLLIDGSNLLHIGYFATKANALRNSEGIYTNGVLVFTRTLLNFVKQLQPTHLAVCWDKEGSNTFRKALYPSYKAHRNKKDEELVQQLSTTKVMLAKMNVTQFESEMYEADDLIGTLSQRWSNEKNKPCYITSNDQDLYQLLDSNITQVTQKKGQTLIFGKKQFENEFGILPENWIDIKGLLGDKSDNIPGVKGVGEKACYPLIQLYGSIDMLYRKLEELQEGDFKRYYLPLLNGKEEAFLSRTLATIVTNVPEVVNEDLDTLKLNINKQAMLQEFHRLQFKSLLQQIQQGAYRVS